MALFHRFKSLIALVALSLTLTLVATDFADARRGGSFGSRGSRTWSSPGITNTAPNTVAPVQRTMTPRPEMNQTGAVRQNPVGATRPGFFSGFGGSLLGGLMVGGLIGMLLGHGIGGGIGFLGLFLQIGLILLGVSLLMRFLRSRREPAYAGASPSVARNYESAPNAGYAATGLGGGAPSGRPDEIGLTADDFDDFERMLSDVQDAYAREDYAVLRARTTPEVMGYLSEELASNATHGLRNEVSGTRLLQGDLADAWRENGAEYATVAMRYESIDVTRERATGRVVEGDPERPTEATELWTFVRRGRGDAWKLSAIQEA